MGLVGNQQEALDKKTLLGIFTLRKFVFAGKEIKKKRIGQKKGEKTSLSFKKKVKIIM